MLPFQPALELLWLPWALSSRLVCARPPPPVLSLESKVEGENQLTEVVLWPPYARLGRWVPHHVCAQTPIIINKIKVSGGFAIQWQENIPIYSDTNSIKYVVGLCLLPFCEQSLSVPSCLLFLLPFKLPLKLHLRRSKRLASSLPRLSQVHRDILSWGHAGLLRCWLWGLSALIWFLFNYMDLLKNIYHLIEQFWDFSS